MALNDPNWGKNGGGGEGPPDLDEVLDLESLLAVLGSFFNPPTIAPNFLAANFGVLL